VIHKTGRGRSRIIGGGGGPTSRWLHNKGCVLCRQAATKVIIPTMWGKIMMPPPAQECGDLLCAGGVCGRANGGEGRAVFCSKDCRLSRAFELFAWEMGIRNYM
jgi:hypothetical protein